MGRNREGHEATASPGVLYVRRALVIWRYLGWGIYFVLELLFTPRTLGLWRRGVACGYPRAETGLRVQIVR